MGLFSWTLWKKKVDAVSDGLDLSPQDIEEIKRFKKLDSESRFGKMIEWGDAADNEKIKTIKFAILNDPEIKVKLAALKRIHLFSDAESVKKFLMDEKTKAIGQSCEPYYSMALSRTGVITIDEFKSRVG